ncbi:MAG TPA: class I SAM-dependent methyltransferase [Acidimicrobiales bacterium]|nr:class I SAM-dependent methyltransferase [Acidimicrobiales bacterium]
MSLHSLVAAATDVLPVPEEAAAVARRRERLVARARGRVLEIGASGGRNLAHYQSDAVEMVVVLAPKAARRGRLMERIASAPVCVEVHEAVAEEVLFEDGWFDTVISTLALCSVADVSSTLASISRLLRPDGSLLLLEHVGVAGVVGGLQRLVTPVWHRVGGCRLDRDLIGAVRAGGFALTDVDRFNVVGGGLAPATWVEAVAKPKAPSGTTDTPVL